VSGDEMKEHWFAEKKVIKEIQSIKEKTEEYKTSEQNAQREGDLAKGGGNSLRCIDKTEQRSGGKKPRSLEDLQKDKKTLERRS